MGSMSVLAGLLHDAGLTALALAVSGCLVWWFDRLRRHK
jgi:hypothetical protein